MGSGLTASLSRGATQVPEKIKDVTNVEVDHSEVYYTYLML